MFRPRQLNPAETAMFQADMSRLPDEHKADTALQWRERCVEIVRQYMSPVAEGSAIALGGTFSAGLGYWMGLNEYKRDQMTLEWQQVTAPNLGIDAAKVRTPFQDVYDAGGQLVFKGLKDPTKWLVPKGVYPTAAFAIAGIAGVGGPMYNRFVSAPAIAGTGFLLGSWIRDVAYKRAHEQQTATPDQGEQAGNGNGGEGNPYRGYPRAA